jgi:hypothetical protein
MALPGPRLAFGGAFPTTVGLIAGHIYCLCANLTYIDTAVGPQSPWTNYSNTPGDPGSTFQPPPGAVGAQLEISIGAFTAAAGFGLVFYNNIVASASTIGVASGTLPVTITPPGQAVYSWPVIPVLAPSVVLSGNTTQIAPTPGPFVIGITAGTWPTTFGNFSAALSWY